MPIVQILLRYYRWFPAKADAGHHGVFRMNDRQHDAVTRRDKADARVVFLRNQLRDSEYELEKAEEVLRTAVRLDPRAWAQ